MRTPLGGCFCTLSKLAGKLHQVGENEYKRKSLCSINIDLRKKAVQNKLLKICGQSPCKHFFQRMTILRFFEGVLSQVLESDIHP